MKSKNLSELNDQELMEEAKKQKSGVMAFRIILGLLMGVAFYSATHKGSFLISCLPVFFITFFIESENNYKALKAEIELRKTKQAS